MRHGASRRALLQAARVEFGEHGYAGARVSRVAGRAGLNKQLIYYYFGSKSGLYAAATADGPSLIPEPPRPSSPAPDVVRAALAHLLAGLSERPDVVALAVDPQPSPDAARQARAWITNATAEVAAAVSAGQGMGYFRDDVDPRSIARQALVACLGYVSLRRYLDVPVETWTREVGDTLLRATGW